jgi:hypothetical protein
MIAGAVEEMLRCRKFGTGCSGGSSPSTQQTPSILRGRCGEILGIDVDRTKPVADAVRGRAIVCSRNGSMARSIARKTIANDEGICD